MKFSDLTYRIDHRVDILTALAEEWDWASLTMDQDGLIRAAKAYDAAGMVYTAQRCRNLAGIRPEPENQEEGFEVILAYLREHGPAGRSLIRKATRISDQKVTPTMIRMEMRGLVSRHKRNQWKLEEAK